MEKANKSTIKLINKQNILNVFFCAEERTKGDLAASTGLSAATTSALIAELVAENWILENRIGESSGGRRPVFYTLNRDRAFIATLRITPKSTVMGFADMSGQIVCSKTLLCGVYDKSSLLQLLEQALRELFETNPMASRRLHAVAISCPGIISAHDARLIYSSILHVRDIDFAQEIARLVEKPLPVFVFKDADALLLGESCLNSGLQGKVIAYILCENGVGLALLINGQLFRPNGMGLELGHLSLNLACSGNGFHSDGGYLGQTLSETAAIRRYFRLLENLRPGEPPANDPAAMTYSDMVRLYLRGDEIARRVIGEQVDLLGWAVSSVVDLFNPDTVIIGSALTQLGEALEGEIASRVQERAIPTFAENLTICNAQYGFTSSLTGMAVEVYRQTVFKQL